MNLRKFEAALDRLETGLRGADIPSRVLAAIEEFKRDTVDAIIDLKNEGYCERLRVANLERERFFKSLSPSAN